MTRQTINVQYPTLNHTESVANISIERDDVNPMVGVSIVDAFSKRNETLFIIVENNTISTSFLTVKAGDAYPNSMLGDIVIEIPIGSSAIQIKDLSRFEKSDGSLDLDFEEDFDGKIYAIAKLAKAESIE